MAKRKPDPVKTSKVEGDDKPKPIEKDTEQIDDDDTLEECAGWYGRIKHAFDNKEEQDRDVEEGWSIYNCELDENQQYRGNTQAYVPVVKDAIDARTQRKVAQLFPANDRHLSAIASDGRTPFATLSLLEHYIRKTKLRSIVAADQIAGDVTGQWNLLVEWSTAKHTIMELVKKPLIGADGAEVVGEEEKDVETKEVEIEGPRISLVATEDVAILPPTVDELDDAELVVFKLRLSKERLEEMRDAGYFTDEATDDLVKRWDEKVNPRKARAIDAGVKTQGTYKYALVYCCYGRIKVGPKPENGPDDRERKALIFYFCGPNKLIGCFENPDWSKKPPLICEPVKKIGGTVWGKAPVSKVKWLQWIANDFYMMACDSAQYRMMPIIMTDPLANPNYQTMVMGLAAVWGVDPNKTKALEFPDMWKDGFTIVDQIKKQIWESMNVTEAMMGRSQAGRKNTQQQAQMAMEQNIPITDEARRYEEVMLEPLCERIYELDLQYRKKEMTIPIMGEIGQLLHIEEIPPHQVSERYFFHWTGTDYMIGLQKMQQQTQFLNVLRGIPPNMLNGRKIDLTPGIEQATFLLFGPDVGPRILIDVRKMVTMDAELENEMLHNGFDLPVNPGDDDPEHLKVHNEAAKRTGDAEMTIRKHMDRHVGQMQAKAQMAAAAAQKQGGGMPGTPGLAGPGTPGAPRMGALPAGPRGAQQPPGAIGADQIGDAQAQPRG